MIEDLDKNEEGIKELLGLLEYEADYFSNILLIPDSFFEEYKIEAMQILKGGTREEIYIFKEKIFQDYLEETRRALKLEDEELPKRAQLNIMLRIHNFFSQIEEHMIICCGRFNIKNSDLTKIKSPYSAYVDAGLD